MDVEAVAEVVEENAERGIGIVDQRREAIGENLDEVPPRAPGVQRIDRLQPELQPLPKPRHRGRADLGEGHVMRGREVDHQLTLAAGVLDRREPARCRRPSLREEQQGCRQLVQRVDARDAMAVEQRLIGGVVPRDGAGVAERQRGTRLGPPDLEHDHGNVALGGFGERRHERRGRARGLQEEADHPCRVLLERVVEVVGGGGHELLARGHHQIEPEARIVVREGAEHGAGMRDEGDVARAALAQIGEARRPDAVRVVVEPHAVAAADRHARRARHGGDALGQGRGRIVLEIAAGKDHGGAGAVADRLGERRLKPGIGEAEHCEIDRLRQVGKACVATPALDLAIVRVDRIDRAREARALDHLQHVVAGRVGPRARAHEGDRARRQQRRQRMLAHGSRVPPSSSTQAKRASRQASAALRPCSLRMRLNSARSGPPLLSMKISMSTAASSAWRMPMIS